MSATKQGNPMSPPEGIASYEKKRYAHPDQQIVNAREHHVMKVLLKIIALKNSRVLNVPCGFGRFSRLFTPSNTPVTYFDLHPKMVLRCKQKFGIGQNSFINGTIRSLPFKNDTYDLVMTIRFFHHYFEPHDRLAMLKELHRVCKRYTIITYYRNTAIHKLAKKLNNKGNKIVMFDKKRFNQEIESAGFHVVCEKIPLPLLHAQRFVLLEKN